MMFTETALRSSLSDLGVGEVGFIFESLSAAYGGADRHYHDASHVTECLTQLGKTAYLATHRAEVEVAIWFHDAVYDSTKNDNEERSADWAREYLSGRSVAEASVARIFDLIMATKTHVARSADEALLLDIDLGILGTTEVVFERYDQAIRREYHWVPAEQYSAGRAQVLRSFLERPKIYQTEHFFDALELPARDNLTRKITQLISS